ncbi:hypothetical protein [Aeromonas salmonicida]|uniref:hypothetical protein n=1 Tax=Aeromonas salmonicida TaxID=645 RepID=UPI000A0F7F5F|nr:hypothetical protein [Aeromonas salmonicida]ORJ11998.1 hypothetical protein A7D02_13240 [Aeromonas salmonicida]ORJ17023.1 hypothetical protein A7D03_10570 [Aeromonas salmonicida]WCH32896.1 hypothetical protein ONZ67_07330 [Aeromonas salmonicida]WCH37106.1 hypothetical protein ONZ60_07395 [Aeromonas salmonicida]WGI37819.1 hypothetical protein QDU35_15725 [Aeromonas salmonicida]
MKNYPNFDEYEAQLVAEIAAWSAMAEVEQLMLDKHRELLKRMLGTLPRRARPCRMAAMRCRWMRRQVISSHQIIKGKEWRLTNLRCEEILPF